jgi:hypothetical protein
MKKQNKYTSNKIQYSIPILVLLAGSFLLCLVQPASAQIIRTNPPVAKPTPPPPKKPMVLKAAGEIKPNAEIGIIRNLPPPGALTNTEKQALFSEAIGLIRPLEAALVIPYALLTPRTPYVAERAEIEFYNLYNISTRYNVALFVYTSTSGFMGGKSVFLVRVKPAKKDQWFLVDCSVGVQPDQNRTFKISGAGGGVMEQTVSGAAHLQMFFQAEGNDWHTIHFETGPAATLERTWVLYSCEVTAK